MTATADRSALSAVQALCALQTIVDEGDPARSLAAREALELATDRLVEVGMLDILITIAARQHAARLE